MLSLSKLAELAKDGSKGGRRSLVSALIDLFVSPEREHAEQVSIMFGEIVMSVLDQLEEETRMALAQRVGTLPTAPRDLVVKLAADEFKIAEPVLKESPLLTEEELEAIALDGSMEHLEAIATRDVLDEKVTNVLVDRGNRKILESVANNENARMADQTFLRLVEKARACPEIQEALIQREDMPAESAKCLLSFLSAELMERVKALGGDNVLAEVMAERAAEEVKARASHLEASRNEAAEIIDAVANKKKTLDEAVSQFARSDRAAELGILLAKVGELPAAAVSRLIYSPSDKPLIIVCKALSVSDTAFKDILTMRARKLQSGGLELNDAINRYAAASVAGAKQSLEAIRATGANMAKKDEPEAVEERGAFMRSKKKPKAD